MSMAKPFLIKDNAFNSNCKYVNWISLRSCIYFRHNNLHNSPNSKCTDRRARHTEFLSRERLHKHCFCIRNCSSFRPSDKLLHPFYSIPQVCHYQSTPWPSREKVRTLRSWLTDWLTRTLKYADSKTMREIKQLLVRAIVDPVVFVLLVLLNNGDRLKFKGWHDVNSTFNYFLVRLCVS